MSNYHQPERPLWECNTCPSGTLWPCQPARAAMLANWTPVLLSLRMADDFVQACAELPAGNVGDLHERFLGWIRTSALRG